MCFTMRNKRGLSNVLHSDGIAYSTEYSIVHGIHSVEYGCGSKKRYTSA